MRIHILCDQIGENRLNVRQMLVNESGYIVPWALEKDSRGNFFINQSFPLSPEGGGTAIIKVTRSFEVYLIHDDKPTREIVNQTKEIEDYSNDDLYPAELWVEGG